MVQLEAIAMIMSMVIEASSTNEEILPIKFQQCLFMNVLNAKA